MKNAIEFWHDVCMEIVRRDFSTKPDGKAASPDQGGPTRTSRALAIAHLAMHDAYFGATNAAATYLQRHGNALAPLPAAPADPISADSALGTAAAVCLLNMYPSHQAYINRMSAMFLDPDHTAKERDDGHRYGEAIAATFVNLRKSDGADNGMGYRPSTAYGRHREDPFHQDQGFLGPQWGKVRKFCIPAAVVGPVHVPLNPPPGYGAADYLSDTDYRDDYQEVLKKGALRDSTRDAEEKVIGYYWGYDGANGIGVPPRLYNQVARAWLDKHFPGNVGQAVKLLAIVNAAMADAGIDAWHWKYEYNLWRPVIGIREASKSTGPQAAGGRIATQTAGNDIGDPGWAPLGLPQTNDPELGAMSRTPGFPAYPSGHATFGAALFQVMNRFTGKPPMTLQQVLNADSPNSAAVQDQDFEFVSDELDGRAVDADRSVRTRHLRSFRNFARPTWENAISRVYLGVHWRFDGMPGKNEAAKGFGGVPLGLAIGNEAYDFFTA